MNLHNCVEVDYTYDTLNRLTTLVQHIGPQNPIASYNYLLDKIGNRTQVTEADGSVIQWGYDSLYRLTSETHCLGTCSTVPGNAPAILVPGNAAPTFVPATTTPGAAPTSQAPSTNGLMDLAPGNAQPAMYVAAAPQTQNGMVTSQTSYSYDAVGNRVSMTANGTTTTYAYNALDQLVSTSTGIAYIYDARGNLKIVTNGATYTFDVRNRLTQATVGGQTATFAYDAMGERIQQVANGTTTNYLWDALSPFGDVVLATATGSMTAQSSYVMDGSELLTQNLTQAGTTTQSYYLQDGQGSVRTLTDASGVPTDRYAYDAFGNAYTPGTSGTTSNPYRYTGQQFDSATGLYDMRARYYDPTQGRFLGRDTSGVALDNPVELNRYAYTANNPINRVDPTGHNEFPEMAEIDLQDAENTSTASRAFGQDVAAGAIGGFFGYYTGTFLAATYLVQKINQECVLNGMGGNSLCQLDPLRRFIVAWNFLYSATDVLFSVLVGAFIGGLYSPHLVIVQFPGGSYFDVGIGPLSNYIVGAAGGTITALSAFGKITGTLLAYGLQSVFSQVADYGHEVSITATALSAAANLANLVFVSGIISFGSEQVFENALANTMINTFTNELSDIALLSTQ